MEKVTGNMTIGEILEVLVEEIKEIHDNRLILKRKVENGTETVEIGFPSLICVLQRDEEPTRAFVEGVIRAQNAQIKVFSADDIGLTADEVGLKGSPTYVSKAFRPEQRGECKFIEDIYELAKEIGGENG